MKFGYMYNYVKVIQITGSDIGADLFIKSLYQP